MGIQKPSLIGEFSFKPLAPYNLNLTVKAYNFSWFFQNENPIIYLNIEDANLLCLTHEDKKGIVYSKVYLVEDKNVNITPQTIKEKIRFILGLDEDLSNFYQTIRKDPLLHRVPKVLVGMRLRTTSLWNALLIGVCQQNASFLQGWKMVLNLHRLFGRKIKFFGKEIFLPPNPKTIVKYADRLGEARLGYRSETLKRIAEAFSRKDLFEKEIIKLDDEEAVDRLCLIRGVGEYTAKLALVFSQRRYSLLPLDRWLMRLASEAYKIKNPNMKKVEKFLLERWGEWCGLAVFFTTIVLDAEPISLALERFRKDELSPKFESEKPTPLTMYKLLY
jgi:3-methyladenine DNA glycosylase/8-oxoguanine DNA glycosylase